ncbi:hypothetical protein [Roseibium sp.]|uniref:hypothetical protein n=1 Tax=Roseibium sp. TaxID=1936156 RepID=UPI003263912B
MNQASIANDGASPVTRVRLLLVSGFLLPLVCGLVFFWPDRTIPNVDDLFFIPWAMEWAGTGRHWNSLLAVQFPELQSYHLQPRLHMVLAGGFFAVAGTGTTALVLFEFLCYGLTSLAFVAICLRLNLRLAAMFTPLLFAPAFVVAGFRLELTGSLLFLTGLLVSLPLIQSEGPGDGSRFRTGVGVFGKFLLATAPLAAPAVFAWSLGAIAMIEIARLASRQAGPVRLAVEGLAALGLALLVFAVSVDFEFAAFFEQFAYHASRSTGGGFNDEAIFRAVLFAAAAGIVYRKARAAALLCASLAAGQFLAAFLHDKALIRNLAASMVFLVAVDAAFSAHRARAKAVLFALLFGVLSFNFVSFYLLSTPAGNAKDVAAAYSRDLAAGRRVFIDEIMAHHYLDQQTDGALAWTWGGTFPKGRPTRTADLEDGDVWYVSEYTLLGYLKGHHDTAKTLWPDPQYRRVPQIPCVLGRQSCNLPQERWTMMRLERTAGRVLAEKLGEGAGPRVLEAD